MRRGKKGSILFFATNFYRKYTNKNLTYKQVNKERAEKKFFLRHCRKWEEDEETKMRSAENNALSDEMRKILALC